MADHSRTRFWPWQKPQNTQQSSSQENFPDTLDADARMTAANNAFGFALLAELRKQQQGKSVFFSPVSIALALQMAYNGAGGTTRQAMAQALQLGDTTLEALNQFNATLLQSFDAPQEGVQARFANALFVGKPFVSNPEVVGCLKETYRAEVGVLPESAARINQWVSQATNGKIPAIVRDEEMADTDAMLLNAIYFKGLWRDPFEKELTRYCLFACEDGRKLMCPLMRQGGTYLYYQGKNFQAVQLPYKGERFHMRILLPDAKTGIKSFLAQLALENWNNWRAQMQECEGDIALPRFRLDYAIELREPLANMGMGIAFEWPQADFERLAREFFLTGVKHRAVVEVNEQGTEAAAVTAIEMGGGAYVEAPRFDFVADRPFVCAIVDTTSDALLFLGVISEPL